MNDQKKLWDEYHVVGNIRKYSTKATDFAREVMEAIPSNSKILELGCGAGNDSIAFVNNGHSVIASDFSEVVVSQNSEIYNENKDIKFTVIDMSEGINFPENSFDVVYARLSLHYFSDDITRMIFKDINKVLKKGGYFCFMCKSVYDSIYGEGEMIEQDMFVRKGHVRHFFSETYINELLDNKYEIQMLKSESDKLYERYSSYIKVIAKSLK